MLCVSLFSTPNKTLLACNGDSEDCLRNLGVSGYMWTVFGDYLRREIVSGHYGVFVCAEAEAEAEAEVEVLFMSEYNNGGLRLQYTPVCIGGRNTGLINGGRHELNESSESSEYHEPYRTQAESRINTCSCLSITRG